MEGQSLSFTAVAPIHEAFHGHSDFLFKVLEGRSSVKESFYSLLASKKLIFRAYKIITDNARKKPANFWFFKEPKLSIQC